MHRLHGRVTDDTEIGAVQDSKNRGTNEPNPGRFRTVSRRLSDMVECKGRKGLNAIHQSHGCNTAYSYICRHKKALRGSQAGKCRPIVLLDTLSSVAI